jgi:hypothetical protein
MGAVVHRFALRMLYTSPATQRLISTPTAARFTRALPERYAIALQFHHHHGYFPDLRRPRTFTEKIQYRKLYDRDPRMPLLVDKVTVKDIVADIIGRDWIIPTLWSGTDPGQIPFEQLTPPYVVKANHASQCNYFVRAAADVQPERIRAEARRWLKLDYGARYHEWAYSIVPRRILVEPLVTDGALLPIDYKFSVFRGRVQHIGTIVGRGTSQQRAIYFDPDWNWMPVSLTMGGRVEYMNIPPPRSLAAMLAAAQQLAESFSYARVDFYEINGRPLFGEMTFYPVAGYEAYVPAAYDRFLGDLWQL